MRPLIFSLLMCLSAISHSQESAFPKIPLTNLTGITATGDIIIAAGSCDQAMYSIDGGDEWTYMDLDVDFLEVHPVPGSEGRRAYLMDRGEIYQLDIEEEEVSSTGITSFGLLSGDFVDMHVTGDHAVIIGAIGIVRGSASLDGLAPLADLEYDSDDRIVASSVTEGHVWVALRNGGVLKVEIESGMVQKIYDLGESIKTMSFGSDMTGYIGSASGSKLYKTEDGGVTWSLVTSFSEVATLHAYGDDVILSRNTNRILVSTDGGGSAEYVPYPSEGLSASLSHLIFADDGSIYMAGMASTVLRSGDFGLTYENLNPYNRETCYSIVFAEDGDRGVAAGYGRLLTTVDGGDTWEDRGVTLDGGVPIVEDVVLDGEELLLVTDEGILYQDGGSAWKVRSEETLNSILAIGSSGDFLGIKNQGGSWLVRKSINGAQSWNTVCVLPEYGYTWSTTDDGLVIISVDDTYFMKSIDHGDSWELVEHGLSAAMSAMHFMDGLNGLVTAGNILYKSLDGGLSFIPISTGYLQSNLHMISEDHYLMTGGQNFITTVKESRDGGNTWASIDTYCSLSFGSAFHDGKYWMTQRFGHLNYTEVGPITSVSDHVALDFTILGNPASRGAVVAIEMSDVGSITDLCLRSVDGAEIAIAKHVSGDMIYLHTAGLLPGVYWVSGVRGEYITTKRLVIY